MATPDGTIFAQQYRPITTSAVRLPRRGVLTRAMAGAVVGSAVSRRVQAQVTTIDFSTAPVDAEPQGFTFARTGKGEPGVWRARADASVPGKRVLEQSSGDGTDYRFPLAIVEMVPAVDVDVRVRFKAIAGRVDRAGGLMIRLTDPDNYYVVRANALEDNVNFYRVVKGSRREIHGASAAVASDVWHDLGVRAQGDRFTVWFDGQTLFTAQDRTFAAAGKVGLWTKADSLTRFNALTVNIL